MKKAAGSALTIVALLITLTSLEAQTNTNVLSTNVLYQALNLNISLTATTNGIIETNANLVTSKPGTTKISSKTIIQLLDGKVVFPLSSRMHQDGYAIPDLKPGVMTNFSNNAKLAILQGLATNHGVFFIVIRDGKPSPVNYVVSQYFSFDRQGFPPATNDTVTTYNLNLDDGSDSSTELYLGELEFDDNAFEPSSNKTAFAVSGQTTARRSPVLDQGVMVDPSAVRSLSSQVAGTGMLGGPEFFAVLRGTINASGPKLEED